MTDDRPPEGEPDPDAGLEDELDPERAEAVRRMLADARFDGPVPEDVAARLDRVLARLADSSDDTGGAVVTDLGARRRRRVAGLLVAAAAVVVAGVGFGHLAGISSRDDSATTSAGAEQSDTSVDSGVESQRQGAGKQAPTSPAPAASASPDALAGGDSTGSEDLSTPVRVRSLGSATFAVDVRRVLRHEGQATTRQLDGPVAPLASRLPEGFECTQADFGRGVLLPVRYDGDPAVLAIRRPVGSSRVAELLQCGTGDVLRSVTIRMQ